MMVDEHQGLPAGFDISSMGEKRRMVTQHGSPRLPQELEYV
jgi:hypothetical protein